MTHLGSFRLRSPLIRRLVVMSTFLLCLSSRVQANLWTLEISGSTIDSTWNFNRAIPDGTPIDLYATFATPEVYPKPDWSPGYQVVEMEGFVGRQSFSCYPAIYAVNFSDFGVSNHTVALWDYFGNYGTLQLSYGAANPPFNGAAPSETVFSDYNPSFSGIDLMTSTGILNLYFDPEAGVDAAVVRPTSLVPAPATITLLLATFVTAIPLLLGYRYRLTTVSHLHGESGLGGTGPGETFDRGVAL